MDLSKFVVSKRIRYLETVLKVELMHCGVLPTDKETAFYQRARAIMLQFYQLSEALIEQDIGPVQ